MASCLHRSRLGSSGSGAHKLAIDFAALDKTAGEVSKLDRRSLVLPLVAVYFVTQRYVHSIPTAGNDLVLLAVLASVGLTLGILCGFATNSEPVATASRSRGSAGLPVAC